MMSETIVWTKRDVNYYDEEHYAGALNGLTCAAITTDCGGLWYYPSVMTRDFGLLHNNFDAVYDAKPLAVSDDGKTVIPQRFSTLDEAKAWCEDMQWQFGIATL